MVTASQNLAVLALPLGPLAAGFLLDSVSPRATMAVVTGSALCVAVWHVQRVDSQHAVYA